MFSRIWTKKSTNDCSGPIDTLRQVLSHADAVVIGAHMRVRHGIP